MTSVDGDALRNVRPRSFGSQQVVQIDLRPLVERAEAASASTPNHLGVSDRSRLRRLTWAL